MLNLNNTKSNFNTSINISQVCISYIFLSKPIYLVVFAISHSARWKKERILALSIPLGPQVGQNSQRDEISCELPRHHINVRGWRDFVLPHKDTQGYGQRPPPRHCNGDRARSTSCKRKQCSDAMQARKTESESKTDNIATILQITE